MRNIAVLLIIISAIGFNLILLKPIHAEMSEEHFLRILETATNRAMQAYNGEDHIKFSSVFADKSIPINPEHYFKSVFFQTYKNDLGKFKSKSLAKDESRFDRDFPFLVYDAIFENSAKVKIKAGFIKQNNIYKISSLQFDKTY